VATGLGVPLVLRLAGEAEQPSNSQPPVTAANPTATNRTTGRGTTDCLPPWGIASRRRAGVTRTPGPPVIRGFGEPRYAGGDAAQVNRPGSLETPILGGSRRRCRRSASSDSQTLGHPTMTISPLKSLDGSSVCPNARSSSSRGWGSITERERRSSLATTVEEPPWSRTSPVSYLRLTWPASDSASPPGGPPGPGQTRAGRQPSPRRQRW
jgi:hypothetical protein